MYLLPDTYNSLYETKTKGLRPAIKYYGDKMTPALTLAIPPTLETLMQTMSIRDLTIQASPQLRAHLNLTHLRWGLERRSDS